MRTVWIVLLLGFATCLLLLFFGSKRFGGFSLIVSGVVAEIIHLKSGWKKYLSPPHRDDMRLTPDGAATAAGFIMLSGLSDLLNVARTSYSSNKLSRNFVKQLGSRYDSGIQIVFAGIVLLGTAITLL